jgi:hypothetical protein
MQKVENIKAHGNAEAVDLLRHYAKEAEKGTINHVTVTVCDSLGQMAADFAGSADADVVIPSLLDFLKLKIADTRRRIARPMPEQGLTCDYVCYNIGDSPTSFDFLPWLVDAEMTRRREDAPAPLKVAFARGQDGKSGLNTDYRRAMFTGVLRPLVTMIGAVEDQVALGGRGKQVYVYRDVVEAAKRGEPVPALKAPPYAREVVQEMFAGAPPVTITLRETANFTHRNSNLPEWLKFADDLERQGQRVIFIRDAAKYADPIPGYETCPMASVNLFVRMALYEQARCNMFVANGPWVMALHSERPWLMFNEVSNGDPNAANTPHWWVEAHGVAPGGQYPWSKRDQRIIWQRDDYKNLSEAWHAHPNIERSNPAEEHTDGITDQVVSQAG